MLASKVALPQKSLADTLKHTDSNSLYGTLRKIMFSEDQVGRLAKGIHTELVSYVNNLLSASGGSPTSSASSPLAAAQLRIQELEKQ